MKKSRRAYLIGCIGCHESQTTLYKLGDTARICGECRNVISRGETLHLKSGGSLKLSEDASEVIYTSAEEVKGVVVND